MAERVANPGEISLNGVRYKLVKDGGTRPGRVRSNFIDYPEKQVFGDFTKDSQRHLSTAAWSDFSEGMGLERMEAGQEKRSYFSTVDQRKARKITLPPLATKTATFANTREGTVLMGELDGVIVAVVGRYVQSYNGSIWTERQDLGSVTPTDILNVTLTTTEYLVVAYTTAYTYEDDITSSWSTSAKAVVKLAYWQDKLWGIDATGQLWYTFTMGSDEQNDAQLPLSRNDAVTGLFTGRDARGEIILYASTKKHLWAHDFGNRRFVRTAVTLPHNLAAGGVARQAETWRDDIMLAANTGFIRYRPGSVATIEAILLGHDDGLPLTKEGRVFTMADSIGDLLIGTQQANTTDSAAIFQWNDQNGFQILWEATAVNKGIDSLWVSDAITNYRCWFGYDDYCWWIRLHDSVSNPKEIKGWEFSDRDIGNANPIMQITPWFNAGQEDVKKIIKHCKVETEDCDANEAIKVEYGLDYDNSTWVAFTDSHTEDLLPDDGPFDASDDRIEGNGITTFLFPNKTTPSGTEFRAIRFRRQLRRGSTTTKSPVSTSLWIEYLKVLPDKWEFFFDVDLNQGFGGKSVQAQRATMLTAIETNALVEFTYRADTGDTRNFYIKLRQATGDEETGYAEEGVIRLRGYEP